jgi:RecA-family ATPase
MKAFIAIDHSAPDHHKHQDFDTLEEAQAHIKDNLPHGFAVANPGGNKRFWVVDATAKTVTRDDAGADAAITMREWKHLREKRDQLLNDTDWWMLRGSITEDQTTYRQALRDLPANTADPANPVWPVAPGA